jgi:uncharacterized OsmC-like protein
MRIIANRFGITLTELEVEIKGVVDVRGTLMIDRTVSVGFERFDISVYLQAAHDLSVEHKKLLIDAAENSCIVMQTIKGNAEINITIV